MAKASAALSSAVSSTGASGRGAVRSSGAFTRRKFRRDRLRLRTRRGWRWLLAQELARATPLPGGIVAGFLRYRRRSRGNTARRLRRGCFQQLSFRWYLLLHRRRHQREPKSVLPLAPRTARTNWRSGSSRHCVCAIRMRRPPAHSQAMACRRTERELSCRPGTRSAIPCGSSAASDGQLPTSVWMNGEPDRGIVADAARLEA